MNMIPYLPLACCFTVSAVLATEGGWEFSVQIVPVNPDQTITSRDGEIVVFDRPDAQKTEVGVDLKTKTEFKPNGSGYFEVTHPATRERTYRWTSGGGATIEGARSEKATITTTMETWGREFDIEVHVTTKIAGKKELRISGDGNKKAVAPKITVKSATFSETGGGNGFTILDKLRGKPIRVPEYVRDDKAKDEDKSPIGFYAGQKPVYQVEFDVQPASLANVTAKCEGGIFTTEERVLKVDGAGGARDKVEGSRVIAQESKSGSGAKDQVKWSFSVYGGVPLSYKENMNIYKYYVLLDKVVGQDKPWKNLLNVAFDKWEIGGAKTNAELMNKVSWGISSKESYYHEVNPQEGKFDSLYIKQKVHPFPVSIGLMIDDCKKGKARVICAEAAALMEYVANVLGQGKVTSRMVFWTEKDNETGETWSNGHAYCLYDGKVHNPVPYNSGPINKGEQDFIDQELKEDGRSDFGQPKNMPVVFQE